MNALTNKRKVAINLTIVDNLNALNLVHGVETKYSASRSDTGTRMKYFNQGIDLIKAHEFRRRYRESSDYQPVSDWVLLISLSGTIEPNGSYIVRSRNRTALAVSVVLDSISEGTYKWPDPGLALDPKMIEYRTTHINWRENKATIRGFLPSEVDLKEVPMQYVAVYGKMIHRIIAEIQGFNVATNQDPYSTEEGRTLMKELIQEVLINIGLFKESAVGVRDTIIAFLSHMQDPHAYIHKGVAFPNEEVFKNLLQHYEGNEEYTLREQHDRALVEEMLVEFPSDEDIPKRLRKMDRAMLDHKFFKRPTYSNTGTTMDFMLGLTNDEYAKIYHTNDEEIAEALRQTVIKRWEEANKG